MRDWIIEAIRSLGVLGIAVLMLLENIFPPLPSEFIMPLAGYLSAHEGFSFWGAVLAGASGSVLGAFFWYLIGRGVGEERLRRWVEAHGVWFAMRPQDVERARRFFEKHGEVSVLFGRLLPVVRTLISVPAGISRMAMAPFLLYSLAGTSIWTAGLAYAGRLLGQRFPLVDEYLGVIAWIIVGGAVVLYLARVSRMVLRG